MKRILAILLVLCSLLTLLVPAASAAEASEADLQRAVLETALAYYYKGSAVQYDSYELSTGQRELGSILRQMNNVEPEEATADDTHFTVCSAFVHDIYYSAFGMHLVDQSRYNTASGEILAKLAQGMGLSQEKLAYELAMGSDTTTFADMGEAWDSSDGAVNPGNMVVAFWGQAADASGITLTSIDEVLNVLEPGDVINIRRQKEDADGDLYESGGHVLLFLGDAFGDGNDYVIHATGSKYSSTTGYDNLEALSTWPYLKDNYNRNGTVCVSPFREVFGSGGSYDMLSRKESVTVLRPLNTVALESRALTDAASFRLHHPALSVYKTADVKPYRDVKAGDTITYTVEIKNNTTDSANEDNLGSGHGAVLTGSSNKTYSDLVLTETIPAGTELVVGSTTAGYTLDGSTLTWNVPSISAGNSTTISYTVQVTGGTQVVSPKGTVSGTGDGYVGTKELKHEVVSVQADASKFAGITGTSVTASSTSPRSGIDVAEDVYGALGYELKLPDAQELADAIFTWVGFPSENVKDQVKFRLADMDALESQEARTLRKMIVPGFVGGHRLFTVDENGVRTNENRLLMLDQRFLQPGDILFYMDTVGKDSNRSTDIASESAYVYLGNDSFAYYENGGLVVVSDPIKVSDSWTSKYSYSDYQILHQAFQKDLFVVLRPGRVGLTAQTASPAANAVELVSGGTTTNYASLAEACTAAGNGDTIKLQENVILAAALTMDKSLTIDLNGYTITGSLNITGAQNTLQNGTVDGVITANGTALRLENLTLLSDAVALQNAAAASVTIKNVSIASRDTAVLPVQSVSNITVEDDLKVLIPDGMTWDYSSLTPGKDVKSYDYSSGTLRRAFEASNVAATGDSYYSVTFTAHPDVYNESKDIYYASLTQALKARTSGNVLRLLRDVDASDFDEVGQSDKSGKHDYFISTTGYTLEMNGFSIRDDISSTGTFKLRSGTTVLRGGTVYTPKDGINIAATVTLENMTLVSKRYALNMSDSGNAPNVTVDNSTIVVGATGNINTYCYAIEALLGTVVLQNGSKLYSTDYQPLHANGGTITVKDATLGAGLYAYNTAGLVLGATDENFLVQEGFSKTAQRQTSTVELDGMAYSFVSDVYEIPQPAASIGDKEYLTLNDALQAADADEEVVVEKSLTVAEDIIIPDGVTLNTGEYTLTLESGVTMSVEGSVIGSGVSADTEQVVLTENGSYLGITIPEGVSGTVHPDLSLNGEYNMDAGSVIKITGTVSTTRENVQLMNLDDSGSKIDVIDGQFSLGNRVAKQMGQTTKVVLVAQSDGKTYVGKTVELCVKSTVEELLGKIDWSVETQAKTGRALVAMLNYGAQAQTYFNYNVGALANDKIGQYQSQLNFQLTHRDASQMSGTSSGKDMLYGTACVLGEELKMKTYFRLPAGTTDVTAEISYKNVSRSVTVSDLDKEENADTTRDYYSCVLEGLTLTDLDERVTVVVKQGDTIVARAQETLRSYLARFHALEGPNDADMADAILSYAMAVKDLS